MPRPLFSSQGGIGSRRGLPTRSNVSRTSVFAASDTCIIRDAWNARHAPFSHVPVPFDDGAAVEWTPAWSLTRRAVRYLPTAFCYFGYPQPQASSSCAACSNGNAAGNTVEEAVLQWISWGAAAWREGGPVCGDWRRWRWPKRKF